MEGQEEVPLLSKIIIYGFWRKTSLDVGHFHQKTRHKDIVVYVLNRRVIPRLLGQSTIKLFIADRYNLKGGKRNLPENNYKAFYES